MATTGGTSQASVTPPVTAAAYTAGNVVGGLLTFYNLVNSSQNSGVLESIFAVAKSVQTSNLKLYLFNSLPIASAFTDKVTPSISQADCIHLLGVYTLIPDNGLGTHTVWNLDGVGKALVLPAGILYGVLITAGTPTFASINDLQITVNILKD